MRRLGERVGAPKRPKRQRAIWPLVRLRRGREAELAPCPSRSTPACVRRELYCSGYPAAGPALCAANSSTGCSSSANTICAILTEHLTHYNLAEHRIRRKQILGDLISEYQIAAWYATEELAQLVRQDFRWPE